MSDDDLAPTSSGPLAGLRVLDLTQRLAGPRCTMLLADFGADVIKIERPPAGDPARRLGPFPHDLPDPEASGTFLHLNTNKRSVTLNLKTVKGQELARALVRRVDAVVENFKPGTLARLGLDYETLKELRPGIVLTSISNFGQDGPYRDLPASEITLSAMGGPMNVTGHREREPLKLAGNIVQYHAGSVAAYATLLALYAAEEAADAGDPPAGDHIDVSIYETQAGFRDRRAINLTGHAYTGDIARRSLPGSRPGVGVRPCADGYVNLHASNAARFATLLRLIGREDLLQRAAGLSPLALVGEPELVQEVEASYLAWLSQRTKLEAAMTAQRHKLLAAPVNTVADIVNDAAFNERGVWETIDHPHTGPLAYPGRPFIMGESPRPQAHRAPLLGEHTAAVLCGELGIDPADLPRLREQGVI
jgi:crotonobetainyl-CoA:carnitine CoA-transferase CaiB-like acyl-CoA transferase